MTPKNPVYSGNISEESDIPRREGAVRQEYLDSYRNLNSIPEYSAALYIRLSREDGDKEESDSVVNQKKILTGYLKDQSDIRYYDLYVDDGYTGTNFERPGFRRMLEDIQAGLVNCVVVKDLSRFGRDYIDSGYYLERVFPEQGVRFVSVTDGIDSLRQSYDMLLPIKNIFNEQYARDISRKIQATMRAKQRAGEFIGAFACYGYRKDPCNRNHLIIDEYAASVVRKIFALFLNGKSKQEIAELLNKEGILCPSEYKRQCGQNYRNGIKTEISSGWTYATVHCMLKNEVYTGAMVQGKKVQNMRSRQRTINRKDWIIVPDTHEAVISKEIWERTQKLLQQNSRTVAEKYEKGIFSGLLFCGKCKKTMVQNRWKRSDGRVASCYYCGTYKRKGKNFCSPHTLPTELLENLVKGDLQKILFSKYDLISMYQKVHTQRSKEEKNKMLQELAKNNNLLLKVRKLKKQSYEDYREGILTREEFFVYSEDYSRKEQLYLKRAEELKNMENYYKKEYERAGDKEFQNPKRKNYICKQILMELIDRIEVREDQCLEIYYRFSKPDSINKFAK
ncbi:MAG: recombinase family protein [Blautia sp.]|uniref:recombinase family protein n=1 Tax=Blautia sp. TaxID=1955243 RepID=UPI003993BCF3